MLNKVHAEECHTIWGKECNCHVADYIAQLEVEFQKLVRYEHLYGAYVRKWMRHIEEDTEYPDFHPVQAAWEALSPETRKAIDEVE